MKDQCQQPDQCFTVGMQKAIVSRPPESPGQDMLQNQPQKVSSGNGSVVITFGFAVNITEGDLAILAGQDIFFPDHATIQISPQVDQCLLARANRLTVNHPLLWAIIR